MKPRGMIRRWVVWAGPVCLAVLMPLARGLAQPAAASRGSDSVPAQPSSIVPSEIRIPDAVGHVVQIRLPDEASGSGRPVVVHIQEAHVHEEAQRNLSRILEHLIRQYGLKLVLVEGGSGAMDLAHLRRFASVAHRTEVAERYLTRGLISGEEYLQLSSDYPLSLWGVEEPALYRANFDALQQAHDARPPLEAILATVKEAVEALKPRVYPEPLKELDQKTAAFETAALELDDYVAFLTPLANRAGVNAKSYPSLQAFLALQRAERQFDQQAMAREQGTLVDQLRRRTTQPEALQALLEQVKSPETLSAEAFYEQLERLAQEAGLSFKPYPHLAGYQRYLTQAAQLDAAALSGELHRLAEALAQALATSEPAKQLQAIARHLDLVEKLAGLTMSPRDYERFTREITPEALSSEWATTLTQLLAADGLPGRSFERLSELPPLLAIVQRFYEIAKQRDDAMVERALKKLDEANEPIAAFISGGFHSPAITQGLQARGVAVVVVATAMTQPMDDARYQAVLRCKQGLGGCEELLEEPISSKQ